MSTSSRPFLRLAGAGRAGAALGAALGGAALGAWLALCAFPLPAAAAASPAFLLALLGPSCHKRNWVNTLDHLAASGMHHALLDSRHY